MPTEQAAAVFTTPTLAVSTGAYTAGDSIGGIQTLRNVARGTGRAVILDTITLTDAGNQKPTGNLLFFNASPDAATTTDNAAFAFSTDLGNLVGRVAIASGDWVTIDTKGVATLRNLGVILKPTTGRNLYAVFVTDGTPDFVATTDLKISYGFL